MNKKLDRIKLYGEKRGWLWMGGEGTKEFEETFFDAGYTPALHWHIWRGLRSALEIICKDGDFQGTCTIDDIWGEAIYVDGRATISIPIEINPKTLIRWGFMEG